MNKIPRFKFYTPKEWEKKRLKSWMRLWKIDNMLEVPDDIEENVSEEDRKQMSLLFRSNIRPFDPKPDVGDIRLLSAELMSEGEIPRYVAVIKKWDSENYLVAPFSKFFIPAVQGELETGREHFSLATLELWNTAIAPFVTLKKSWLVDKMSDQELKDSFNVFKFISSGDDLPEHLEERIGPPIFKDNDPRVIYQDKESQAFVSFREACLEDMYPISQSYSEEMIKLVIVPEQVSKPRTELPEFNFPFDQILALDGFEPEVEMLPAAGEASLSPPTVSVDVKINDETHSVDVFFEWNNSEKVTEISLEGEFSHKLLEMNSELTVLLENGDQYSHIFDTGENSIFKLSLKNVPICGIILSP